MLQVGEDTSPFIFLRNLTPFLVRRVASTSSASIVAMSWSVNREYSYHTFVAWSAHNGHAQLGKDRVRRKKVDKDVAVGVNAGAVVVPLLRANHIRAA